MRFVDLSVGWRPLKLYPLGTQASSDATMRHRDDPSKTYIYQQRRFLLKREKPEKLDSGFLPTFDDSDLLRTSELLVAGNARDRISKCSSRDRGDLHGVVSLDALL